MHCGHPVALVLHLHDDRQLNENQCILSNELTDNRQWNSAPKLLGIQSILGFNSGAIDRSQDFTKALCLHGRDLYQPIYCPRCPTRGFPANVTHTRWERCYIPREIIQKEGSSTLSMEKSNMVIIIFFTSTCHFLCYSFMHPYNTHN